MTLCVCDLNNFTFWDKNLKILLQNDSCICPCIDQCNCWLFLDCYVVGCIFLCMGILLVTRVASTPSHCSNRFIRSSLLVGSYIGSLLYISVSFVVMVSLISLMVTSGDFKSSGELSGFFLKLFYCLFSQESI